MSSVCTIRCLTSPTKHIKINIMFNHAEKRASNSQSQRLPIISHLDVLADTRTWYKSVVLCLCFVKKSRNCCDSMNSSFLIRTYITSTAEPCLWQLTLKSARIEAIKRRHGRERSTLPTVPRTQAQKGAQARRDLCQRWDPHTATRIQPYHEVQTGCAMAQCARQGCAQR